MDCTDATVRKAYLTLVKRFPPDVKPERFKKINNAYLQIKTEKLRLKYYLFNTESYARSPGGIFLDYFRESGKRKPLDFLSMKKYLKECTGK